MSYEQDPNEQANISGADLAILIDELAESQAREKVLRDALVVYKHIADPADWSKHPAEEALAQPTDDSTLQNLIIEQRHDAIVTYRKFQEAVDDGLAMKAALAAERERCAKEADRQAEDEPYGHAKFRCANIAAEIRTLGV